MDIRKFASFNFALTYQMAGAIREFILSNEPEEHVMDFIILDDFIQKALKPSKTPMLYNTIESCLHTWIESWTDHYEEEHWKELLISFNIDYEDILENKRLVNDEEEEEEDCSYEMYKRFITKGLNKLSLEVFTLLFGDRLFLMEYHKLVANYIRTLKVAEDDFNLLEKDGIVNRSTYWPVWLTNALIHREKGKCAICNKDLTALFSTVDISLHIDHIVPLKLGGTNDTTNLQVLCETHNLEKGGHTVKTTGNTPLYWEF
ncbi:HNH endonuclease [Aquimarina sp. 2201CG1-2-11]|uniref:HNH endonuclease n=1 Tax=Aquimarina discodermiae TaxID=3231043 RepID=UPI0034617FDD